MHTVLDVDAVGFQSESGGGDRTAKLPSVESQASVEDDKVMHSLLAVKDQQGSEVQYNIQKSTQFRQLMNAHCIPLQACLTGAFYGCWGGHSA